MAQVEMGRMQMSYVSMKEGESENSEIEVMGFTPTLKSVSPKVKAIVDRTTDLPSMPDVAFEVMRSVEHAESTAQSIAAIISRDQSLSARVLRLSNSSFYGMSRKISSIRDAIVILGLRTVKSLALVSATFPWLKRALRGRHVDPDQLWQHSLAVAHVCQSLAQVHKKVPAENTFCIGVLHNLGLVVLSVSKDVELDSLMLQAQMSPNVSFDEIEQQSWDYTHAEVGAFLIDQWNLPEDFVQAIQFHHRPDDAPIHNDLIDILHIADWSVRQFGIFEGLGELHFEVSDAAFERLGLSREVTLEVAKLALRDIDAVTEATTVEIRGVA